MSSTKGFRKDLHIMLSFLAIIVLASGCQGQTSVNNGAPTAMVTPTNPPTLSPPDTPTPARLDLTMGQTGQLDGWKITLVSAKLDMDYQVQSGIASTDENHHLLDNVSYNRVPVIVCHLRITNIGTQTAHISATSAATVFTLLDEPYVSGDTGHGLITPYVKANIIDTDVPVGATIEGDAPYAPYVGTEPGPGDAFMLIYDTSAGFGDLIRWHFTV